MLAQAVYLHRRWVQKSSCRCRNVTKCPWTCRSWCIHLIPVWPIHPPWPNLMPVLDERRIGKCKWAASYIGVWFSYSLSTSHGLTSTVSLIHVVIMLSSGSSTVTSWGATAREQSGKCLLWAKVFFFFLSSEEEWKEQGHPSTLINLFSQLFPVRLSVWFDVGLLDISVVLYEPHLAVIGVISRQVCHCLQLI